MASDGKVIIDTELNNNGFIKGIQGMERNVDGLTASVRRLGKVMASVFTVRALVSFGKEAIQLGSDLEEVQNVVDVAFGDMAYKVEAFADTAIQKFGISRLAAKKTASTYMAMARGMGISADAASNMAISLTGLSADVASFYNISQELADVKLKSVFTGETETLKDLGVVMTQANLKAFALEKGIKKDISAMSQAELVALRYQFVMKQLSLAHGDFARTSNSWANQTRILSMQWQEFMSIVGQTLITVLTPLVKMLNTIVSALIAAANTVNSVVSRLFGGANTQIQQTQSNAAAVGSAIADSVEQQDDLTDATKKTAKAQKGMLAGFDEINKLSSNSAGGSGDLDLGTGGGMDFDLLTDTTEVEESAEDMAKSWIESFLDVFKNAWANEGQATVDAIKDSFSKIKDLLAAIGRSFAEVFTNGTGQETLEHILRIIQNITGIVGGLADSFRRAWEANETGTKIIQHLWDILNDVLGMWERITAATKEWAESLDFGPLLESIENYYAKLEPLVKLLCDGLAWAYENVLLPLEKWRIEKAVPAVLNLLAAAFDFLRAVLEKLKPTALWIWDNVLKPIAKWSGELFISALNTITSTLQKLTDLLDGKTTFKDFVDNLTKGEEAALSLGTAIALVATGIGIYNGVMAIASAATTAFGVIMGVLTSPIGMVTLAIAAVITIGLELYKHWDEIGPWLKETWESIKQKAVEIWGAIKEFFSETWEHIKSATTKAWDAVKEGLTKIWEKLKETATTVWTAVKDFFAKTWEAIKAKATEIWENIKGTLTAKWNELKLTATTVWNAVKAFFQQTWDAIKAKAIEVWNDIKAKLTALWDGLKTTVSNTWTSIKTAISDAWDNIKTSTKETWDSVVATLKQVWESIKSWWNSSVAPKFTLQYWKDKFSVIGDGLKAALNAALSAIENAINWCVNQINKISFTIPDWVPELGGKSFGINIPTISIPRLAQGAVIPPNREFLAVLGDQKQGTNVEAPLSTITEATAAALRQVLGEGGGQRVVVLKIGEREMGRIVVDLFNQESARVGVSM